MKLQLLKSLDRIDLNGSWDGVCYRDGESFSFAGTVPGCAHTDLKGIKLPDDLFYRDNAIGKVCFTEELRKHLHRK